jgi:AcrR family transcriptional regulator
LFASGQAEGVSSSVAARPQQERSRATRQRLLDAAVECLITRGWSGTTTTVIAETAGVSRGAQLHHYPTKTDLVLAAVDHLTERRAVELRAEASRGRRNAGAIRGSGSAEAVRGRANDEAARGHDSTEASRSRANGKSDPGLDHAEARSDRGHAETAPGHEYADTSPGRGNGETARTHDSVDTSRGHQTAESAPARATRLAEIEHALRLLAASFTGPLFQAAIEIWVAARTDEALRRALEPLEAKIGRELYRLTAQLLGADDTRPEVRDAIQATLELLRGLGVASLLSDDSARREAILRSWAAHLTDVL